MMPPVALPRPVVEMHEGLLIVRDDLIDGGTKRRVIHTLFDQQHDEYVYASPVFGYAQVALAYACRDAGKKAVIFCAKRKQLAPLTQEAADAGAIIHEVPAGYLVVVQARARDYCAANPAALLLPFGLNDPRMVAALADVARTLPLAAPPTEVWTILGSGTLSRALQQAWPGATFFGVKVGAEPDPGRAKIWTAAEKYERKAEWPPPFPSCSNYDAKAWRYLKGFASEGALFWNVAR